MRGRGRGWLETAVRTLGRPLEARAHRVRLDAAIVLGAPVREDGTLPQVVEERVRTGVELWQAGLADIVVMTGGFGPRAKAGMPEAKAMGARARELGLPSHALVLEMSSRTTKENAERTAEILHPDGRRRVWIVTQPFHLRRAVLWFRRSGFEAYPWWIDRSVQYADPRIGLRWVLREYVAWAHLVWLDLVPERWR